MKDAQIKIGDAIRHTHLLRNHKLYVANVITDKVVARYITNDKIETIELFIHEIELIDDKAKKEISFGW